MTETHVSAAILFREGMVLAARRAIPAQGDPKGELREEWELPGGKVEPGEAAAEALRREVREELGCELGLVWPYDTVTYDYPDFRLVMDCFVCTPRPGSEPMADPAVHAELRWLARDELLDVAWLPADVELVRSLGQYWSDVFAEEHL